MVPIAFILGLKSPLDVVFLLDTSFDNSPETWSNIQTFVKTNVINYPLSPTKVRVAIINFSNSSKVEIPLDKGIDRNVVLRTLYGMSRINGIRNVYEGFRKVKDVLFNETTRGNAGKVVVAIIGGPFTNKSLLDAQSIVNDLKLRNIKIAVIGIGKEISEEGLRLLSDREDHVIKIESSDDFPETLNVVSKTQGDAAGMCLFV